MDPTENTEDVAVPYLGARISLISNSNIRYEGVLYTVDSKEASVTLEAVRCFGTEGRCNGIDEIPGSMDVYDYIIFSGKDIKDLTVITEEVKPKKAPPQDPAIMMVGASHSEAWNQHPNAALYNGPGQFDNSFEYPGPGKDWAKFEQPVPAEKPIQEENKQQQHQRSPNSKNLPGTGGFLQNRKGKVADDPKAEGEFDFELSNARFNKSDYRSALTQVQAKEDAEREDASLKRASELGLAFEQVMKIKPAYDKTKSFFDEISTGRDVGRTFSSSQERAANKETFGQEADGYRGQRRGGRRGLPSHRNREGQLSMAERAPQSQREGQGQQSSQSQSQGRSQGQSQGRSQGQSQGQSNNHQGTREGRGGRGRGPPRKDTPVAPAGTPNVLIARGDQAVRGRGGGRGRGQGSRLTSASSQPRSQPIASSK